MGNAINNPVVEDSLAKILRKIPKEALERDEEKSFGYLYRDYLILTVSIFMTIFVDSFLWGLPFALLSGVMFMGIFVIGHDAGHRSFSSSNKVNNLVGHLTTSLCLWPFHVWRLSHDLHHRHTHNIKKEIAWRPMTISQFERRTAFQKSLYKATRTGWVFISSIIFTWYFFRDGLKGRRSQFFEQKDMPQIRFSIAFTLVLNAVMIAAAMGTAGFYGLLYLYVIPQLVFQALLSTYTYFHHTAPDRTFLAEDQWSMERAQLANTIDVKYPKFLHWANHDIMVHVPHHVCVAIPHYNLKKAHKALKEAYPDVVKEEVLDWNLIKSALNTCHLVRDNKSQDQLEWVTFNEVEQRQAVAKPVNS